MFWIFYYQFEKKTPFNPKITMFRKETAPSWSNMKNERETTYNIKIPYHLVKRFFMYVFYKLETNLQQPQNHFPNNWPLQ